MSRQSPKAFATLLQSAVNEPGTLSQAYQQFHSYSLGNQLLAWRAMYRPRPATRPDGHLSPLACPRPAGQEG